MIKILYTLHLRTLKKISNGNGVLNMENCYYTVKSSHPEYLCLNSYSKNFHTQAVSCGLSEQIPYLP